MNPGLIGREDVTAGAVLGSGKGRASRVARFQVLGCEGRGDVHGSWFRRAVAVAGSTFPSSRSGLTAAEDVERASGLRTSLTGSVRVSAFSQPRTALCLRASARSRCASRPLTPVKVLRFPACMMVRDSKVERITGQEALMIATGIVGGVMESSRQ